MRRGTKRIRPSAAVRVAAPGDAEAWTQQRAGGAPLPAWSDHFLELIMPEIKALIAKAGADSIELSVWSTSSGKSDRDAVNGSAGSHLEFVGNRARQIVHPRSCFRGAASEEMLPGRCFRGDGEETRKFDRPDDQRPGGVFSLETVFRDRATWWSSSPRGRRTLLGRQTLWLV